MNPGLGEGVVIRASAGRGVSVGTVWKEDAVTGGGGDGGFDMTGGGGLLAMRTLGGGGVGGLDGKRHVLLVRECTERSVKGKLVPGHRNIIDSPPRELGGGLHAAGASTCRSGEQPKGRG